MGSRHSEAVMARSILPPTKPPHRAMVRMVLTQAALGAALGLAFALALLLLDVHGLGGLIRSSETGPLAFLLLAGGFMVTGGSVVAGTAIMMLKSDDDDRDGGHFERDRVLVPIPVRTGRPSSPVQRRFD